jgi:LuxR family maltose regulon positive regulatory protein
LAISRTTRESNGTALAGAAWSDWLRLEGRARAALDVVRTVRAELTGRPAQPPAAERRLVRAEALAHLALGDPDAAEAVLAGAGPLRGLDAVRARVALGRPAAGPANANATASVAAVAVAQAEAAVAAATGPGRAREQVEALAVAALARAGGGDEAGATALLTDALRTAAPAEWVTPFIELGEPLLALVAALPADQPNAVAGMRKRVLDAVRGAAAVPSDRLAARARDQVSQGGLVDRLTERELAVLRRLPSSLTTAEIAGLLYVSLNTVKTQIQSVYRKLGVNSRHEAVERARELGLL